MKLTRHRMLLAGVVGVAAVVIPVSVPFVESQLAGVAAATSTLASPDHITYVQGTGTGGTYFEYIPGDGSATTTQVITPSGRCGTPTVATSPAILGLSGLLYPPDRDISGPPDNDDYLGSPSPVPVGSSRQHTGVCGFPSYSQIENVPFLGEEGLDFTTLGANPAIGSNRIFSDAQIQLQSEQWWPGAPIPVTLVELLGGSQVGSTTCTIPSPVGSIITADTNGNSSCSVTQAPISGFDTVEVEVPHDYTAVSVVGTSTFTLAPQVCGGQSISSSGPISATLSIPSSGGCQSYTSFSSSIDTSGNQNLTYDAYSPNLLTVPYTFTTPWAPQTDCAPVTDPPANPLPTCSPSRITLNGSTYTDQSYCSTPTTADPLCTENKTYNYTQFPGQTQITETWGSLLDWGVTHH